MSESSQSSKQDINEDEKYEMQEILGEGTYGVVYKAILKDTE